MIDVIVETPTDKVYKVGVEGSLCRRLIDVFDEIADIECKTWIYERLNREIVHSTPHFIGNYLGYSWRKIYDIPTADSTA